MKNLVILIGRIGETPATRQAGDTAITNFSMVTTQPKFEGGKVVKDEKGYTVTHDEWHRITCFNGLGKSVAANKKKGDVVEVQGRLHYSKWTDKDGTTRYSVEIIADEVLFL